MKLNLKRPLAFFDLEATGTNIGIDRIVEISVIKVNGGMIFFMNVNKIQVV